jgi:hypothetical protein
VPLLVRGLHRARSAPAGSDEKLSERVFCLGFTVREGEGSRGNLRGSKRRYQESPRNGTNGSVRRREDSSGRFGARRIFGARSVCWRPADRALVRVSGLHMRCALPDLIPEAQTSQDPCAKPAGRLAQLCLPGLRLVGVVEPNRSWGARSPTPRHAASVSSESRPQGLISVLADVGVAPKAIETVEQLTTSGLTATARGRPISRQDGGISFGGVISFIFADLIILPILVIYKKYYGTKMMLFILATF